MTVIETTHGTARTPWLVPWLTRRAARLGKGLAATFRRAQVARLRCVLYQLTDEQLTEIGVRRRDIPGHAARLIQGSANRDAR